MIEKALVTGAGGFVGTHLVDVLRRQGVRVVAVSRSDIDLSSDPREVEELFRKILRSSAPDVVIHLAGPKPYAPAQECERVCLGGTTALLRALDLYKGDVRLVVAGSSTEYGYSTVFGERLTEEHPANPSSPYGKAKLGQTEAVLSWGGAVLRLFNCIGPGQKEDVVAGRIVHQIVQNKPRLAIRETASKRDFLDVRDAVQAFVLGCTTLPAGIYNVCSGKATSIDELISKAFEAASVDPVPIDIEIPDAAGSYQCGDPSKIESFGWVRRFDILDSLRDSIQHERERLRREVLSRSEP